MEQPKYTVDYPFIRAWHKTSGSFDYYIENLVARARSENAPQTAIYRDNEGKWHTFDDIKIPATWERIADYVNKHYRA